MITNLFTTSEKNHCVYITEPKHLILYGKQFPAASEFYINT